MNNVNLSASRRHFATGSAGVLAVCGALAAAALPAAAAETPEAAHTLFQSQWMGEPNGTLGFSVSATSCDINGDGTQDTVLGDWGWDRPGYPNTGAAYVALGSSAAKTGDVADPDLSGTIRIDGPSVSVPGGAWVGWSVSCLGDVNGDGLDDFVLGAGSRNYQQATVVFGQRDFTPVDLDFLGTRGFVIEDPGAADRLAGDKATDNFGYAVSRAGDVDGDGLDDIAIGDVLADYNGRSNSGRVWIIKGQSSVRNVDVQNNPAAVVRTIDGANAQDRMAAVAAAGDVNGDGTGDQLVSAYTATPWGSDVAAAGAAYAVWGSGNIDLAALGNAGFMIYGPDRQRDRLGASVAGIGDINGDGFADLAVGADGVSRDGAPRTGGVAVILGSDSTAPVLTNPESETASVYACSSGDADASCSDSELSERGYWINGAADGGRAGASLAAVPDLNADGIPELLIGAPGSGEAWIAYGAPGTSAIVSLADLAPEAGLYLGSEGGTSVGSGADLNADGTADVIAGGDNAVTMSLLATAVPGAPVPGEDGDAGNGGEDIPAPSPSAAPVPQPSGGTGSDNGPDGSSGESGSASGADITDDSGSDAGTGLAATGAGGYLPYAAGAAVVLLAAGIWLIAHKRRRP